MNNLENMSKAEIAELAHHEATNLVESGFTDALKEYIKAKREAVYLEAYAKALEFHALAEFTRYGERQIEVMGAKVESRETGVKYDYSKTGDQEHARIMTLLEGIKENQKERETYLKALKKPIEVLTEDGEVIKIHPPIKKGKESLAVTI